MLCGHRCSCTAMTQVHWGRECCFVYRTKTPRFSAPFPLYVKSTGHCSAATGPNKTCQRKHGEPLLWQTLGDTRYFFEEVMVSLGDTETCGNLMEGSLPGFKCWTTSESFPPFSSIFTSSVWDSIPSYDFKYHLCGVIQSLHPDSTLTLESRWKLSKRISSRASKI